MASYSKSGTHAKQRTRRIVVTDLVVTEPGLLRLLRSGLLPGLLLVFLVCDIARASANNFSPTTCAQCHSEALSQPATDMARSLEPVEQSRILIDHPILTATYGKYSYRIERSGNQSLYAVTDGTTTVTMPIRWVFGASSAIGQTYILEKDGELYESRVSWFRELNSLGPTLGGGNSAPADVKEAAGRLMSHDDKLGCFGCHATNARDGKRLTLEKMTPGVQCGRCHEGTEDHVNAMVRNSGELTAPAALSKLLALSAEQMSNFCGQCHRTWAEIAMHGAPSIANIRFQPYRLTGSRCYDPDDVRISCVACHNPHEEVNARPVDYDTKCQACHQHGKTGAKACPVSKSKCVTCHMPKIELPGGHYKFSDHRIRIVRPNERYPG
jgi:cytochrome c554/c'-like protein